jgi:putative permease
MELIRSWFRRHFSDPQVVFLGVVILVVLGLIIWIGDILAPVIASVVVAYLLEGIIRVLERQRVPRLLAVSIIFLGFMVFVFAILFGMMPLLSNQVAQLVQQIPAMLTQGQAVLMQLPSKYPELFSVEQVDELIRQARIELTSYGQYVVSFSLASVPGMITILVYAILLPFLVFFFLKDKRKIINWAIGYLPADHHLAESVWQEVDRQIGNYIRGKFWEILIVWFVSFVTFSYLGLDYAMLLGVLVGLSVLVPFVGAAVVTIPVELIAWFQWGWSAEFITLTIAYLVIQALDGNVLVPLLFSEVVNLHPVAIIVAVLFFGGLWGVWGVFFAIPLATTVQAILKAWPRSPPVVTDSR